ncbi:valine--tRNA ligase [archaeon]|nr:MAG: valine--tRNA ligase [archaeon]
MEAKLKEKWDIGLEKEISKKWKEEKIYAFDSNSKKKKFVIDTPPPYPSGRPWHIGAVAHYSEIDMIARTARMMGHATLFPIGIDRNGIGVERYTEKKYNISIHKTPREKFIEFAKHALDDLEAEMIQIMKSMGMSGDFDNYYRTDSDEYRKLTQSTFIELWGKGMIYEDTRPNNYCIDCGTTIADAEVVYEDKPSKLVHIKFNVNETGKDLIIATTRPELLCACQAVLVNPDDDRYKKHHGKHVIIPIYDREVQIIPHSMVKMEFGSGAEMVCSYGDYNDVRLFRELKLAEIIAIDMFGRMTKNSGKYAGMKVKEARAQIVEDLGELVLKKEDILHRTPTCERSRTEIEIIPMNDFYLKQLDFVDDLRKYAETMTFHPEIHRQILLNWIDSVSIDWPISRRRFYATEIPIWYCKDCRKIHVPKSGKYYQPWKGKAPFEKCECGSKEFIGEDRTFDTWFDSGISPLFISKYLSDKEFHKKTYPNTLRPQGKDIVRTWLYYSLLRCYQVTGEFPFKHAWVMGYAVDEKGEKMSKSKGNVIDPMPILEKFGSDMFRLWAAAEVSLGSDFRVGEQRIMSAGKFLNKLWNISRFISMFPVVEKAKLTKTDEWILGELGKMVKDCMDGYNDFNFFIPSNRIREFVWNVFADHYIEIAKARIYGEGFTEAEQKSAWYTLHTCLHTILSMLAPIMPFITDHVSRELYGKTIHKEFPKAEWETELSKITPKLIEFNSQVWGDKKSQGISLKDSIKVKIPKELEPFEKDLKAMHHIQS